MVAQCLKLFLAQGWLFYDLVRHCEHTDIVDERTHSGGEATAFVELELNGESDREGGDIRRSHDWSSLRWRTDFVSRLSSPLKGRMTPVIA